MLASQLRVGAKVLFCFRRRWRRRMVIGTLAEVAKVFVVPDENRPSRKRHLVILKAEGLYNLTRLDRLKYSGPPKVNPKYRVTVWISTSAASSRCCCKVHAMPFILLEPPIPEERRYYIEYDIHNSHLPGLLEHLASTTVTREESRVYARNLKIEGAVPLGSILESPELEALLFKNRRKNVRYERPNGDGD